MLLNKQPRERERKNVFLENKFIKIGGGFEEIMRVSRAVAAAQEKCSQSLKCRKSARSRWCDNHVFVCGNKRVKMSAPQISDFYLISNIFLSSSCGVCRRACCLGPLVSLLLGRWKFHASVLMTSLIFFSSMKQSLWQFTTISEQKKTLDAQFVNVGFVVCEVGALNCGLIDSICHGGEALNDIKLRCQVVCLCVRNVCYWIVPLLTLFDVIVMKLGQLRVRKCAKVSSKLRNLISATFVKCLNKSVSRLDNLKPFKNNFTNKVSVTQPLGAPASMTKSNPKFRSILSMNIKIKLSFGGCDKEKGEKQSTENSWEKSQDAAQRLEKRFISVARPSSADVNEH